MPGFEPRKNNRGNFACPYCSHKTWKGKAAAVNHIKKEHSKLAEIDEKRINAEAAKSAADTAKWQAENRAARAERELAELKKKKAEEQRYSAVVYCPTCLSVDSVNIVRGQGIGDGGCFRCGTLGGKLVEHVNVSQGNYQIRGA